MHIFRYLAAGIVTAGLGCSVAEAQTSTATAFAPPPVPSNLAVPEGNTPFLKGRAQGTQNYICLPAASGFAWTFFSPQATLFFDFRVLGAEIPQQIITHFLSPNPAEGGTGRATWQSSFDSSAVWARTRTNGSSTDANFVAAGAIPWLVLEAVGMRRGPTGGDTLAQSSFV